jgi:hypothetical protein
MRPISLRDITEPTIAIDCRQCGRHGEYNVEKLCQRHSPDLLLTIGRLKRKFGPETVLRPLEPKLKCAKCGGSGASFFAVKMPR